MNKGKIGEGTQTWGAHRLRIPVRDWQVLCTLIPELNSKNGEEQTQAWERFWNSNLADQYRVARSPKQVKRSNKNKIIIK